jgi:hypothetical protein
LISLLLVSSLSALPPSEAVMMTYHLACNLGELRLDKSEAKVADGKKYSTPGSLMYTWGAPESLTYVDLSYAPTTYIVVATYRPKYPQQVKRVCQVHSNAISRVDAERAFLSAVHKPNVTRDLNPARGRTPFEIDRPKEGFHKRLIFLDAGWVIMETAIYKEPH